MKHGVLFEEAKEVFNDPLHLSKLDHRFSYFEERWITIGKTSTGTILVVANLFFSADDEEIIRIRSYALTKDDGCELTKWSFWGFLRMNLAITSKNSSFCIS